MSVLKGACGWILSAVFLTGAIAVLDLATVQSGVGVLYVISELLVWGSWRLQAAILLLAVALSIFFSPTWRYPA